MVRIPDGERNPENIILCKISAAKAPSAYSNCMDKYKMARQ